MHAITHNQPFANEIKKRLKRELKPKNIESRVSFFPFQTTYSFFFLMVTNNLGGEQYFIF